MKQQGTVDFLGGGSHVNECHMSLTMRFFVYMSVVFNLPERYDSIHQYGKELKEIKHKAPFKTKSHILGPA